MSGRRVTTAVTLLVLLVVLVGMAVYGFRQLTAPLDGAEADASGCSSAEQQVEQFLNRSEVQVSVYNAGSTSGLAGSTLDKVEAAGFKAGNAGNAPTSADVRRAIVWTTKADDPAAALVAQAFGRGTKVEVTDTDLGPGVDVLVGDRFKGLDPKAPKRIQLAEPVSTCVEVD